MEVMNKMNDFVILPKVKRIVSLACISFIFVAIGILLLSFSSDEIGSGRVLLMVIGLVAIIVFGFCLIYYINVLIKRKPALIISDNGIFDNSSFIGAGLVKW